MTLLPHSLQSRPPGSGQVHSGPSRTHSVQPSPPAASPSSHSSFRRLMPLPHWSQVLRSLPGGTTQLQPVAVSTVQSAAQPSAPAVFLSSHSSADCLMPSPQLEQPSMGSHVQPGSSTQSEEQPSES